MLKPREVELWGVYDDAHRAVEDNCKTAEEDAAAEREAVNRANLCNAFEREKALALYQDRVRAARLWRAMKLGRDRQRMGPA